MRRDDPPPLSRRTAITLMAAAAASAAAGRVPIAPASGTIVRPIPSTGEQLPAVGLGTWRTFAVGASAAERAPLRDVLRQFVALGGRVVDSSPMYGTAEAVVGDLAAELAVLDSLFLATKVWTSGREAGVAEMERSFRRLRRARLDLLQVHNLVDWRTQLSTLRAWKEGGRIRYLGITHYTAGAYGELERLMRDEPLDFVQLNYSLAEREAEQRLLPLARERGIAVLVNRPLCRGRAVRARAGARPATLGRRFQRGELGAVLPQVDPGPSGRHLRDPGHQQAPAPRRQHGGGHRRSTRRGHPQADDRSARNALSAETAPLVSARPGDESGSGAER